MQLQKKLKAKKMLKRKRRPGMQSRLLIGVFGHPTFPGNSGWFSNHFGENFENENSEEQVAPVPDIDTAV